MKICENCDSTSMEMCLLVRHCKHWVSRPEGGNDGYEEDEDFEDEEYED